MQSMVSTGHEPPRRRVRPRDPGGLPGLDAHAHTEFGIPVIGVAKSAFATATHAVAVLRESLRARCLSPPPGCPAPTRQNWSAAWRADSGYRTRCAAPTHSLAPAHRRLFRGALTPAYTRAERGRSEVHAERWRCIKYDLAAAYAAVVGIAYARRSPNNRAPSRYAPRLWRAGTPLGSCRSG
jgi:hypothetical protein